MTTNEISTAQTLFDAFMRFRKMKWMHEPGSEYKPSDMRLMFCIRRQGQTDPLGIKVSDISNLLRVAPPTVTQLLSNLELKGLVERTTDPTDRRVIRVRLTEKGDQVTQEARERIDAKFEELVAYLGERDCQELIRLMTKVSGYLHRGDCE